MKQYLLSLLLLYALSAKKSSASHFCQFKSCFLQNFLLTQYIPAQMAMARMRYTGFFSELSSDWPKRAIMATITALPARRVSR